MKEVLMKWITHKAVAVAGALAVQASPAALIAILVGSVLPDMVDTIASGGNRRIWSKIHRQTSHWFGWYLILIFAGFTIPIGEALFPVLQGAGISFPGVSRNAVAHAESVGNELVVWLGIGGVVHVLLDALTPMRVPVFPFGSKRRFGINLVSTGTWQEYAFLVCAVGVIAVQFEQARFVFEQIVRFLF